MADLVAIPQSDALAWAEKCFGLVVSHLNGHHHTGLPRCQWLVIRPVDRARKIPAVGRCRRVAAPDHDSMRSAWIGPGPRAERRTVQETTARYLYCRTACTFFPSWAPYGQPGRGSLAAAAGRRFRSLAGSVHGDPAG